MLYDVDFVSISYDGSTIICTLGDNYVAYNIDNSIKSNEMSSFSVGSLFLDANNAFSLY